MGAFDFIMTQTRNEAYMSSFTPEQLEHFYGLPTWVVAAWGIAVWGGVGGSILLLLRKSMAVKLFLFSVVSGVLTTIHYFLFSDGLEFGGDPFSLVFSALIFIVAVALFLYARTMNQRGALD